MEENTNNMDSSQSQSTSKKLSFDDMTREDLVKKCKGLLLIAQKAKQAKTEISNEYETLKEKCQKLETQKAADKESLKTMQEFVDSLTEQKLNLEDLKQKNAELLRTSEAEKVIREKLNAKLKLYREKLMKCASSITQLKNSKFILLKTVAEYSESVPKWKTDIINASQLMSEQLLRLENENKTLKSQLSEKATSQTETSDTLTDKIEALESEKLILINEKTNAKDTIQKLESEKSKLQKVCDSHSKEISSANSKIIELNNTIALLENEKDDYLQNISKENQVLLDSLMNELQTLKTSLVSIEEENKLLSESNDNLTRELKKLSESTEFDANLTEHNKVLQADISKLSIKLTAYKTENSCLLHDLKEVKGRLIESERSVNDYEEVSAKLATYKNENLQVLNEMKEVNEVLKERGETIQRQHNEIAEANNRIRQLEGQINKRDLDKDVLVKEIEALKQTIQEKDSRLKTVSAYESKKIGSELKSEKSDVEVQAEQKDSIISALRDEIEKLKITNSDTTSIDAPDDNLSVSTVSHAEESSRLKDVDGMLEQKYMKLRRLAIKLKRTISELNEKIKTLEEEKDKLLDENKILNNSIPQNLHVDSKAEASNYEPEADNLKDIQQLLKSVTNANEKVEKIQSELSSLKTEKLAQDIIIKQYESDIKKLKNTHNQIETPTEATELKAKLTAVEAQLTSETAKHKQTLEALEKARRDVKKKSVLSLEMEDYERSMKELTLKMDENKKKIVQMESTIDTQEGTITSLRTQIKMLEDQLKSEENIVRETQELLNNATENLKEKEVSMNTKDDEISKLRAQIESLRLNGEETTLQLTAALGEKEKSITVLSSEKMDLSGKLKKSELRFIDLENEVKLKNTELENIKTEFNGYKIRATAVLRQNQNKDLDNEENLKDEINTLKSELKALNDDIKLRESEYDTVLNEKNRLVSRTNELQLLVTALQTEREKVSEQFNSQLEREILEQKNMKVQMATLTQCYKKQICDIEEKTSTEISNLQKELEFARTSLARTMAVSKEQQSSHPSSSELKFVAINNPELSSRNENFNDSLDNANEINVSMLEREEGEGSESTPSPSPTLLQKTAGTRRISRNNREPVPLEQLLEEGVPDENSDFYGDNDLETKFANAMKQIENQNKRLAHMTELVAEAEREVMRRSQLAEALKEEVRRYQRSVDRASHHHNQEYLKNVIIKFVTLGSGDERSRLVPVLHTILTLSPDETNQLMAVARGQDPNANRSWGSYLPWPGNTKN